MERSRLFDQLILEPGLVLRNRIVMAPMTTWSSNEDGTLSDEEDAYYRRRSKDAGLVITGCTHVQPNGVGFTGEFAAYDDRFIPSLSKLAAAAKSGGAPAILQIFHAGVKTLPELVSDVVAASAVEGEPGPFAPAVIPRSLREEEIFDVIQAFGDATRRAIAAGFDGVELHGAHGFLIQNFFSPHSNRRTDRWGGSLENRMRFPLAVVEAVKTAIDEFADRPFAVGYRISVEEAGEDGLTLVDSIALISRIIDAGANYIHASLGSVLTQTPRTAACESTIVSILRNHIDGKVPLIAAGRIKTPEHAASALDMGVSLVAIGQGLVIDPDWVAHARAERADKIRSSISASDVDRASIPRELWRIIESTPGWFDLAPAHQESSS
ncbi:NADH-dependent flavin oxidoreductase [Alcaligenaceae bacterium C4P045]|nr:NADH-dependent flavin oxidoreductase [Alcaligenaceae bacterium C4P045]